MSLAEVVWEMAEEMMRAKGFNDNFSAYIADLMRRDKERQGPTAQPQAPPDASTIVSPSRVLEAIERNTRRP